MRNWFKKHKAALIVVGSLIGGPAVGIYINTADVLLDTVAPVEQAKDGK